MAHIKPVFKMRVDKITKKRVPVLDKNNQPIQLQKWRIEIRNADGSRSTVTIACKNESEAKRKGERLQFIQDEIKSGNLTAFGNTRKLKEKPFSEAITEYMNWGAAHGGRQGRPWSKGHTRTRKIRLAFWEKTLKIKFISELESRLGEIEAVYIARLKEGKTGKTVAHELESLRALCTWAKDRSYLQTNPLEGIRKFDTAPKVLKRAMTEDEVERLLNVAPPFRRILYKTALLSGLRAEELRHLTPNHLDVANCALKLDAEWTKDRRDGSQPIPRALFNELVAYAQTNGAKQAYIAAFRQCGAELKCPENPLLYVPKATATTFDVDLRKAGIAKATKDGKLDFHALRVTYINNLLMAGIDPKTVQTMARHKPGLFISRFAGTESSLFSIFRLSAC